MILGEIITGEECFKRGYSNDSMGELIDEKATYADMFVRSKLLHKLSEIDNKGSFIGEYTLCTIKIEK